MKKKVLAVLAAVLLTATTTFAASTYMYTIDCGDGVLHRGYIGASDIYEARAVAWDIAEAIC